MGGCRPATNPRIRNKTVWGGGRTISASMFKCRHTLAHPADTTTCACMSCVQTAVLQNIVYEVVDTPAWYKCMDEVFRYLEATRKPFGFHDDYIPGQLAKVSCWRWDVIGQRAMVPMQWPQGTRGWHLSIATWTALLHRSRSQHHAPPWTACLACCNSRAPPVHPATAGQWPLCHSRQPQQAASQSQG
jgi:hypothetical protein